ncbi:Hypothetical protein PBC10988_6670 [Planctomycetales bacterium 10988]|nr:Hypothetical protein PBC10988_6670 [Planctomycetales bacterium 10988]
MNRFRCGIFVFSILAVFSAADLFAFPPGRGGRGGVSGRGSVSRSPQRPSRPSPNLQRPSMPSPSSRIPSKRPNVSERPNPFGQREMPQRNPGNSGLERFREANPNGELGQNLRDRLPESFNNPEARQAGQARLESLQEHLGIAQEKVGSGDSVQQIQANVNTWINTQNHQPFTAAWYLDHPNAWQATHPHADAWAMATWGRMTTWLALGTSATPVYYSSAVPTTAYYETTAAGTPSEVNVNIDEVTVVQPSTTEEVVKLAKVDSTMPDPNDPSWMSLGVYALSPPNSSDSDQLLQIYLNQNGQVTGTYLDLTADTSMPFQGSVDKETQRVAWKLGETAPIYFESTLAQLTQPQSPVTLYIDSREPEIWMMVQIPAESLSGATKQ